MSSELSFTLAGTAPSTNVNFSIRFIYTPSGQVQLACGQNSGGLAIFNISNLPPFLQANNGLYLGTVYPLQFQGGYLKQAGGNTYSLVNIPDTQCFSISPVDPDTRTVMTFNSPCNVPLTIMSTDRPINIISPTQCMDSCDKCGSASCVENFECYQGQCKTQLNLSSSAAFGIRIRDINQGRIYTYTIVGNSLVVHLVSENNISALIDTNDIFRERWFYADYIGDQDQLTVGQRYQLYTFVKNTKYYISAPIVSGQMVTYTLSPSIPMNVLTFTPKSTVNWGEYTIKPSEFENLALPNGGNVNIALWQNNSVIGSPAVVNSTFTTGITGYNSTYVAATTCSATVPCTGGQVCVNNQCQNCSATSPCTGGQVCTANGTCQTCSVTVPCPTGQNCVSGKCQAACTSNTNCTGGQVCDSKSGKCQNCTADSECNDPNQICSNGACVKKPFWKYWWFWVLIAIAVIILILIIVLIFVLI
jgi:hypothetical protein